MSLLRRLLEDMVDEQAVRILLGRPAGAQAGVDLVLIALWWPRRLSPLLSPECGWAAQEPAEGKTEVTCSSFQHVAHLWFIAAAGGIERSEVQTLRASREKKRTHGEKTFLSSPSRRTHL